MSRWVSSQSYFILPGTEVYFRRKQLAEQWGTEIRHPTWWREHGDHHELATDLLPGRAWAGREHELRAFFSWQNGLNRQSFQRYAPEVHAFRQAFYGS